MHSLKRIISLAGAVLALALLMAASASSQASSTPEAAPAAQTLWLKGNGLRLKTTVYQSAKLSAHPTLIVVLHGDLLGRRAVPPTTYHYVFAQNATSSINDVVAAAILRPGYRDNTGEYSEGDAGLTTGDNYTPQVVDAIAQVIDQLKDKFHPLHTVIVGHSGGAAISADLLGRWPGKVDGALLISCPCDLAAWRKHMMELQNNNPIWEAPVESLSPIDPAIVRKVSLYVHVSVLVGSKDDVAPLELSQRYAGQLRRRGREVTLTIAPGLEHDILLDPVALDALKTLIKGFSPPLTPLSNEIPRVPPDVMDGLLVHRVEAVYPQEAKTRGIVGDVTLQVTIDKEGNVIEAKPFSGHPLLGDAAIDAVLEWRYRPYLVDDKPVAVMTTVKIHFQRGPNP